jgi:hypothetical protein
MLLLLYARTGSSNSSSGSGSSDGSPDGSSSGSSSGSRGSDFGDVLVRLVVNEQVVRVPGCRPVNPDGFECSLQDFLQYVVGDKTAADRFQRYCYGHGMGLGLGQSTGLPGSTDGSSSSTRRSDRSEGVNSGGQTVAVRTADGLQVVLGQQHSTSVQLFEE